MNKLKAAGPVFLFLLTVLAIRGTAGSIKPLAIEHSSSIVQRPDGNFDVTCVDGVVEVKTKAEVMANQVCTHLESAVGRWLLTTGGVQSDMRMCDVEAAMVRTTAAVIKAKARFLPPCLGTEGQSQQCTGSVCEVTLDTKAYSFDFSTTGTLVVTRTADGLSGTFEGPRPSGNSIRLTSISNAPNVLQVSDDNGTTWRSVCDDGFSQTSGDVACRQLGFSRATGVTINVTATGDSNFGLDDVACNGSENSLMACPHLPWGQHNCGDSEHVSLTCGN